MNITTIVSPHGTNMYLISDNGAGIVIDPADGIEKVIDRAASNGITIKHALVTHSHFDHIGGVAALCRMGATLYMSRTDYELVKFDGGRSLFGAPKEAFTPDVYINDGDTLSLIGHEFKIISTPGHTPGGVCFCMDGEHLFSGDTLFMMSIGRTDFEYGSYEQLSESIVNKLFVLDGNIKVYPGHGDPTTIDHERKYNRYV